MSFLCFDGRTLTDQRYELYEISFIQGVKRLMQPWRYYLHGTMGRSLIVRTGIWAVQEEQSNEL